MLNGSYSSPNRECIRKNERRVEAKDPKLARLARNSKILSSLSVKSKSQTVKSLM